MIRRREANGCWLIRQDDHAQLSGQIAQCWGNDRFEAIKPAAPVIRAIALHDGGWPMHDDKPQLNETGLALDVFEMPLLLALSIWRESVDRLSDAKPPNPTEWSADYCTLLVSLHALGLSGFASNHPHSPREVFEINKFQQREFERQHELRKRLQMRTDIPLRLGLAAQGISASDDRLRHHFQIMQVADRLSLALCSANSPFIEVKDVTESAGGDIATLQFHRTDAPASTILRVEPWPFDRDRIDLSIAARVVPQCSFTDRAAFDAQFAQAPRRELALSLVRAGDAGAS